MGGGGGQPSFYTVLCGDSQEYAVGDRACFNPSIPLLTKMLDRNMFPNGAMNQSNLTSDSR